MLKGTLKRNSLVSLSLVVVLSTAVSAFSPVGVKTASAAQTVSKTVTYKGLSSKDQSKISPQTINYNENGHTGTLKITNVEWTPEYKTNRTTGTLTKSETVNKYLDREGTPSFANTVSYTYTDKEDGNKKHTFTLNKSGSPVKTSTTTGDEIVDTQGGYMAMLQDAKANKVKFHSRLGWLSNTNQKYFGSNTGDTFVSGKYYFKDSLPSPGAGTKWKNLKPGTTFGEAWGREKEKWTVTKYRWGDSRPYSAREVYTSLGKNYNVIRLKWNGKDGDMYYSSSFGDYIWLAWTDNPKDALTRHNEYRKGADVTYKFTGVKYNNWRQDYKGNLKLPDIITGYTAKVTYSGKVIAPPKAGFNPSKNPATRLDKVTFTSTATDPDGEKLSYTWNIRKKGSSSWGSMIGSTSATYDFTKEGKAALGDWEVKQTVKNESGLTDSVTKVITVKALKPTAGFNISPSTTNRLNKYAITSTATNPYASELTYKYEIRLTDPSSGFAANSWKSLSSNKSFSAQIKELYGTNPSNTYQVRQTVTNEDGESDTALKTLKIEDLAPVGGFKISNVNTYINDTVSVTSTASDPEKDAITYLYKVTSPSGKVSEYKTANFSYKVTEPGEYKISQVVTDVYGLKGSAESAANGVDLSIKGKVSHTKDWEEKHAERVKNGIEKEGIFYSGEQFILEATTTTAEVSSVYAELNTINDSGKPVKVKVKMVQNETDKKKWEAVMEPRDEWLVEKTRLAKGQTPFTFTATYKNGTVRSTVVNIEIDRIVTTILDVHKKFGI